MISYLALTPERLRCLEIVAARGGRMSHDEDDLVPFCSDASTLTTPDVFNQCHNAGWLFSTYDDRVDASFVMLTVAGREALDGGRE